MKCKHKFLSPSERCLSCGTVVSPNTYIKLQSCYYSKSANALKLLQMKKLSRTSPVLLCVVDKLVRNMPSGIFDVSLVQHQGFRRRDFYENLSNFLQKRGLLGQDVTFETAYGVISVRGDFLIGAAAAHSIELACTSIPALAQV